MLTSSEAFAARLAEFRSRAWLVLFARDLCVALMTTSALVTAVRLLAGAAGPVAWTWTLVAVAVAVAAAAIASYLRRPSLRATASIIDRRLALEDRVVAGLQVAADEDVVARLVVREALKPLQRALPPRVFPFQLRRLGPLTVLVFAGAVALPLTDLGSSAVRPTSSAQRAAASGGGASGAASQTPQRDSNASVAAAAAGERRAPDAPRGSAPDDTPRPAAPSAAGASATSPRDNTRLEAPGAAPSPSNGVRESIDSAQPGSEGQTRGSIATGARSAGAGGGAAAGNDASQPSAQGAAARGGSSDAQLSRNRSGGVGGGALTSAAPASTGQARSSASSRSVALAAKVEAEAVMMRDDIPPDLRPYVRDYFRALQSGPVAPRAGQQR
jgi:hypothetical protein